MLDIARIEAGRLPLSFAAVRVREVVEEALRLVAPLAADGNVELRNQLPQTPDPCVVADSMRLRQVILNLLSNAVKYNHPGGTVAVSGGTVRRGWVRLSITDTGPGIPREKIDRLFLPFERLGAERGGREGTGIGLTISKGLVELMGGAIGVESAEGKGSTFWVDLRQAHPDGDGAGSTVEVIRGRVG